MKVGEDEDDEDEFADAKGIREIRRNWPKRQGKRDRSRHFKETAYDQSGHTPRTW